MLKTRYSTLLPLALAASLIAAIARADEAQDQYHVAARHYSQQRWELACDEFQAFAHDHPTDAQASDARFYAAEALMQLQRYADARAEFQQLLAKNPDHRFARQASFRLGEAGYLAGNSAQAEKDLQQFHRKYPQEERNSIALSYLGELKLQAGETAAAEKLFRQAIDSKSEGPHQSRSRFGLAKALENQGQSEEANRLYQALAADKNSECVDRAQFAHLNLCLAAGQCEEAAKGFQEFGDAYPHSPLTDHAKLGQGTALYRLGRFNEAAEVFKSLEPHASLSAEARYWHGMTLVSQKNSDQAIELFEACLKSSPSGSTRGPCLAALLNCQVHGGQFDEAKKTYELLRQTDGQKALALRAAAELADAAYDADERKIARELFASLADRENPPRYAARGLSGLAWVQFRDQDWAAAAETFARLLARYPEDPLAPEAALLRGHSLEKLNQPDAALEMDRLVIEKYPDSSEAPQALLRAARLEESQNHQDLALAYYARLANEHKDFSDLDEALYRQWRLLVETKNGRDADTTFSALQREFRNSRFAYRAACQLAEERLAVAQYDEAKKLIESVLSGDAPADSLERGLYLRGKLAVAREHWSEVEKPLARLLEDFPDGQHALSARFWMAEAEYRQGHFQEAATQFAGLAERSKDSQEKWIARVPLRQAQALAQLDEWTEAFVIAGKLEANFPEFDQKAELDYLLGRCLANRADFAAARERYRRVIHADRDGKTETAAMAQWMIGESYFHQENFRAALAEYLRVEVLYDFPCWQSAALLQAGKCQERLGQWRAAAETYARLVKVYPESGVAADAAHRLEIANQKQQVVSKGK